MLITPAIGLNLQGLWFAGYLARDLERLPEILGRNGSQLAHILHARSTRA